jgi:hypothetical protein
LRLTDDTWKKLGIVSECLGLTRADYLEEITKHELLPYAIAFYLSSVTLGDFHETTPFQLTKNQGFNPV